MRVQMREEGEEAKTRSVVASVGPFKEVPCVKMKKEKTIQHFEFFTLRKRQKKKWETLLCAFFFFLI